MSTVLATYSPPISPDLLQHLSSINIITTPDFIFTPPTTLLRLLPQGSTTLSELKQCIALVTSLAAGEFTAGDALYELEMSLAGRDGGEVRSGVAALDAQLGGSFGGVEGGRVVEVSGESGSGKTVRSVPLGDQNDSTDTCKDRHWHCTSYCTTSRRTIMPQRCGWIQQGTCLLSDSGACCPHMKDRSVALHIYALCSAL